MSINFVAQSQSRGCHIASLAMITNQSYSDVVLDFPIQTIMRECIDCTVQPHRKYQEPLEIHNFDEYGITMCESLEYLRKREWAWQTLAEWASYVKREVWPPKPWAPIHLCEVHVVGAPCAHAVVMDQSGVVYDPVFGIQTDGLRFNQYDGVYQVAGLFNIR